MAETSGRSEESDKQQVGDPTGEVLMTMSPNSRLRQDLLFAILAVALTLMWVTPAFAQRDTGIIVVRAIDPDGVPLPGVQVVARGPVGTQTQHTGIDGSARFPGLYPGPYTATFTLDGFKTVIREDLIISAQRVTSFDITMGLATIEETVTVTGGSPVVDVKSTDIAALYTDDLIDKTPTASGLWAGVIDHVPGIASSFDVGGGDSGQQRGFSAWGSERRNNTYNVNGGDTTDPAAVGGSSSYFSVGSFEEVSVSLAAQDIEIKTPGVNINMVVKSGSNDWHAGVKYFYEGEGLVSNNVDAELEAEGVTEGTPNELLSDLDVQGGGPIIPDRAWFFVDYWNFDIRRVVLGLEERERTKLRDWTLNFNGQIDNNNKISGRYIYTKKYLNNRGASRGSPYAGRIQDSNTKIPQLQWQSVINQNIFSDVRFSTVRSNFPTFRRGPGTSEPDVPYQNWSVTYDFNTGEAVPRPSNPWYEFDDERDTDSLQGTASWYVTGENVSQDVKFGGNYMWINYFSPINYPQGYRRYVRSSRVGDPKYDPDDNPAWEMGVPVEVRLYNAPIAGADGGDPDCFVLNADCWKPNNAYNLHGRTLGLFVQDTVTIANKVTIAAGLRFDRAYNWNPAQNRLDSPWCGETALNNPEIFCGGTFPEQEVAFRWNDFTPRIGLVYDIIGDGRWAAKFNYARYAEALGISYGGATNVNDVATEDWDWFDPNGDGIFQFGEHMECGEADPFDCFRSRNYPGVGTAIDPELRAPLTDEFTFGIDHELFDNILVSVTGIFRSRKDDVGTVDIGRPFGPMIDNERCQQECTPTFEDGSPRPLYDPWEQLETVDPGDDGVIGTADDGNPVPIWALNPNTFDTSNDLTTNPNTWGFQDDTWYKGVSFVVSKRWSNNWQILASYDYGDSESEGSSTTPNGLYNGRRQLAGNSAPHIFKLTGNYLIAEPVGVNLGVFVRAQSGESMFADYTYDDSVIEPPNGPWERQSNTRITVMGRGESEDWQCPGCERPEREPFTTLVDIRAEKQVTIGRYGVLHFYFDVFNLFNANTVTELNERLGGNWLRIDDILPPRVIRLGGAWDF